MKIETTKNSVPNEILGAKTGSFLYFKTERGGRLAYLDKETGMIGESAYHSFEDIPAMDSSGDIVYLYKGDMALITF